MRITAFVSGIAACVLGVVAFGVGWFKADPSLQTTGGAIAIAGLTLVGVAAGLQTWQAERAKGRELEQRRVYAETVERVYGRFHDFDLRLDAKIRAQVVTWAVPGVVAALDQCNRSWDRHVGDRRPMTLSPDAALELNNALAHLVVAIRKELNVGGVEMDAIRGALFNYDTGQNP